VIVSIYKYMWSLRKLTIYCHNNNINYGLHNNQFIKYDLSELISEWNSLKQKIILDLKRMECELYE